MDIRVAAVRKSRKVNNDLRVRGSEPRKYDSRKSRLHHRAAVWIARLPCSYTMMTDYARMGPDDVVFDFGDCTWTIEHVDMVPTFPYGDNKAQHDRRI